MRLESPVGQSGITSQVDDARGGSLNLEINGAPIKLAVMVWAEGQDVVDVIGTQEG